MHSLNWILCLVLHTLILFCVSVDPNNLVSEIQIPEEVIAPIVQEVKRGCRSAEKESHDREFRIAWLAPKQEYHNFSAATSIGAMKLALAYIDQHILYTYGWKLR